MTCTSWWGRVSGILSQSIFVGFINNSCSIVLFALPSILNVFLKFSFEKACTWLAIIRSTSPSPCLCHSWRRKSRVRFIPRSCRLVIYSCDASITFDALVNALVRTAWSTFDANITRIDKWLFIFANHCYLFAVPQLGLGPFRLIRAGGSREAGVLVLRQNFTSLILVLLEGDRIICEISFQVAFGWLGGLGDLCDCYGRHWAALLSGYWTCASHRNRSFSLFLLRTWLRRSIFLYGLTKDLFHFSLIHL